MDLPEKDRVAKHQRPFGEEYFGPKGFEAMRKAKR